MNRKKNKLQIPRLLIEHRLRGSRKRECKNKRLLFSRSFTIFATPLSEILEQVKATPAHCISNFLKSLLGQPIEALYRSLSFSILFQYPLFYLDDGMWNCLSNCGATVNLLNAF